MNYDVNGCKIKNILSLNEIITISKQRFSCGYFFRGESHNFYEAVCVLNGTVGITSGKKVFVLSKGQMTIHRPTEFHAIWEHDNSNPTCIIFSFSASAFPKIRSHIYNISDDHLLNLENIYMSSKEIFDIDEQLLPPSTEFSGVTEFDLGLVVSGIKDNMYTNACRFGKELELFLMSVLNSPSNSDIQSSDNSSESYAKVLEIMDEHINDRINMNELSKLCGMSAPLIEKLMYKYLRCGAMAYYNNIRMDKAYYLLSHGENVKNVANILNFTTQNYFSMSFKKHFGYPPSQIKNIFLKQKAENFPSSK